MTRNLNTSQLNSSIPCRRFSAILVVTAMALSLNVLRAYAQRPRVDSAGYELLEVRSNTSSRAQDFGAETGLGSIAEPLANRAVDAVVPSAVATLESVPGAHGFADGVATDLLLNGRVDWGRTITTSSMTTILGAVVAPEGVATGVAVDLAGGWLGDQVLTAIAAYPQALVTYGFTLATSAVSDR